MSDITDNMRKHSSQVVDGIEAAPARAMLRAVGFNDEDFRKPQVGIASTWSMVTPCNMHIDRLATEAAKGADAAGVFAAWINNQPVTLTNGRCETSLPPGTHTLTVSPDRSAPTLKAQCDDATFLDFK